MKVSSHKLIKEIDSENITIDEKLEKLSQITQNKYTENYRQKLLQQKINNRMNIVDTITKEQIQSLLNNEDLTDNEYLVLYLSINHKLSSNECVIKKVNKETIITETDRNNKNNFIVGNKLIINNYDRFGYGTNTITITDKRFNDIVDKIDMNNYLIHNKNNSQINNRTLLNSYRISVFKKYTRIQISHKLIKQLIGDRDKYDNKITEDFCVSLV